jgi:uncharacterized protein (DUF2147 family)
MWRLFSWTRLAAALTLALGLAIPAVAAQMPITGYWLTQGGDGVIQVYACGADLCGRIAGFFLDRRWEPTPRDYRGVSQCGLPLIDNARPEGPNSWRGTIVNPRNGKVYGAELHLTPQGDLALRGFLGIPLLGQTQIWTRYKGQVPADCRILARPTMNDMEGGGG